MTGTIESKAGRRQRAWRTIAFAALCVCLVGAVAVSSAGAKQATVLGKTKKTPTPNCPRECEAVGSVTGFPARGERQKAADEGPP